MRWSRLIFAKFLLLVILIIILYYLTNFNSRKAKTIFTARGHVSIQQIEEDVFKPLGLSVVDEEQLFPTLKYDTEPKCEPIYSQWLEKSENYDQSAAPPKEIPNELRNDYLLAGYSHIKLDYVDNRSGAQRLKYDTIEELIKKPFEKFRKDDMSYGKKGGVYMAMQYHGLAGLVGVVIGSMSPWVEVCALKNGAKKVITVEYLNIEVVGTDKVEYIHAVELARNPKKYFGKFDFAVAYSSLEHSGLGRYGDVPDPIGDIREMQKIRCLIKDGGLYFFGVHMGPDAITFNLHRIYGRIRLAIMFTGFELVNIFEDENPNPIELTEADFAPDVIIFRYFRQPVFVLRKI